MKKLSIKKEVAWMEKRGKWHRTAWQSFNSCHDVCYPIGIHWIAMFLHRLWDITYFYKPSRLEKKCALAEREVRDKTINQIDDSWKVRLPHQIIKEFGMWRVDWKDPQPLNYIEVERTLKALSTYIEPNEKTTRIL